ncbi:MAG: nitrogen fixation protein NifS, partial [Firmicutes bacterium]|nr:nitrogen fixation protein NifS [Bacillota bacterium]
MERWSGAVKPVDVIYLDHAATTPPCPAALEAVRALLEPGRIGANPSSPHRPGRRVRALLDDATVSRLGASPGEVVFTSGGTEA